MGTIKGMFMEITAKELWLATLIVAVLGVTVIMINNGAADEIVANASSAIESAADWVKSVGSDSPKTVQEAWDVDNLPSTDEFEAGRPNLSALSMPVVAPR